jgi:hypothetical protein
MPALNTNRFKRTELLVYGLIWLTVYLVPFFHDRVFDAVVWSKLWADWVLVAGFMLMFFLNVYVLVPLLFFKKRYLIYATSTLLIAAALVFSTLDLGQKVNPPKASEMPPMEIGPDMPPMELGHGMPATVGFKPTSDQVGNSTLWNYLEYFLISILIIAASTSYKLFLRWINEERKNESLENERLKSELALLRLQVSPHFLMNTLNNIYALIVVDQERAGDAVIRLSTLMRYLLYDTRAGKTTLPKELEFIESYFMLMKLRYPKNVDLKIEMPTAIPDIAIPAMLFISFLENAFKHGVSYERSSFVHFKMNTKDDRLNCFIQNSVHPGKIKSNDHYSGIGLTNVRHSLDLLYPDQYELDIRQTEADFTVSLSIPL